MLDGRCCSCPRPPLLVLLSSCPRPTVLRSTTLHYALLLCTTEYYFILRIITLWYIRKARTPKFSEIGMPSFPNKSFTTTLHFFNRSKGTDLQGGPLRLLNPAVIKVFFRALALLLRSTTLYYAVLLCTTHYYSALQSITLYYALLLCTTEYYFALL